MPSLSSVDDLIEYSYRALGKPVINIEVEESQAIDRVEDALQLFTQRHYDGSDEVYIKHLVTSDDVINGFITVEEGVSAVIKLYGISSDSLYGEEFERLNFLIANSDIIDSSTNSNGNIGFYLTKNHIETINNLYKPKTQYTFNAISHILTPFDPLIAGHVIVYKCYQSLDVDTFEDVYNNEWIKKYVIQLIKRQWGTNLKKFSGVALPGNVSMNGQVIYDEAQAEIEKLEDIFSLTYEEPINFRIA